MRRCSSNPHGTCSGTLNSLHRVWHAALPKCATVRAILTELALNLNSYTFGTNARDVQRASQWMRRVVVTVTSPDEALPTDRSRAAPLRKHLLLHHQPTKRRSSSFFGGWRLLVCYPIAWVLSEAASGRRNLGSDCLRLDSFIIAPFNRNRATPNAWTCCFEVAWHFELRSGHAVPN